MGQLSLLSVLAAFLITGVVVFNANRSADNADQKVWEHQYHVMARDVATSGMAAAVRDLTDEFVANTNWNPGLANSLQQTDVDYGVGTYTITASAANPGPAACPLLNSTEYTKAMTNVGGEFFVPQGDLIRITVTGSIQAEVGSDADQRHQIEACYLKADFSQFSPPAFDFGFFAEDQFTFNGGPTIQALVDGEGHIHSNNHMDLGPQVEIDGNATYVNSEDIHNNADITGGHGFGPTIPVEPFVASEFATENGIPSACNTAAPDACRYDTGFTSSGDATIEPPSCSTTQCEADPFIWYINGDLVISGNDHITVPQYTTIVVTGNITISGGGAVTTNGVDPPSCNQNNAACNAAKLAWVQSQLFDGVHSPLAWYAGNYDVNTSTNTGGNVTLNGAAGVVGNFYVNGDVLLNGGGTGMNTVGSFTSTMSDVTANGGGNGNNFWFLEVAEENVIDGVKLPGKQIVRLALAEWTDPILDN